MLRISILVVALACGGGDATDTNTNSNASSASSATSSSSGDEDTPTNTASNGSSNIPSGFSIRQGGGPVGRDSDYVERQTTIEQFGGGFVIVVRDVPTGGEPTEVSRVDIDGSDVEPIYELIVERRTELSAECINANIRGGSSRRFFVMLEGEEVEFRCTNSATPAFEALWEAFDDLVILNTPAH